MSLNILKCTELCTDMRGGGSGMPYCVWRSEKKFICWPLPSSLFEKRSLWFSTAQRFS